MSRQRSIKSTFAGGELADALDGRVDITRYATSVQKAENFYVTRFGAIQNRPGTEYICEAKSTVANGFNTRLLGYRISDSITYMLEFSDNFMRVFNEDDEPVLTGLVNATYRWTASAIANEWYLEAATGGNPFPLGQVPQILKVSSVFYKKGTVGSLTSQEWNIGDNDSLGYTTVYVHSLVDPDGTGTDNLKVDYQLYTGITAEQAKTMDSAQDKNVLYLANDGFAPKRLVYTADDNWTIENVPFNSDITPSTILAADETGSTANDKYVEYAVTGVDELSREKMFNEANTNGDWMNLVWGSSGRRFDIVINSLSELNTVTNISGANYYVNSTSLYASGASEVLGNVEPYGLGFYRNSGGVSSRGAYTKVADIASLTAGTWCWDDPGTGYNTICFQTPDSLLPPISVYKTWFWHSRDPASWRIYKRQDGDWGWVADIEGVPTGSDTAEFKLYRWIDVEDTLEDFSIAPRYPVDKFATSDDYPRAVDIYQQRLCYAGSNNNPQTVYMSATGQPVNFAASQPMANSDYVEAKLSSGKLYTIRRLSSLDRLLAFTDGSEWTVDNGVTDDAIAPTSIRYRNQGYSGSDEINSALTIDNEVLFVQRNSKDIRSMQFRVEDQNYLGDVLTYFVPHLFEGKTIKDWCYQKHPDQIVWIVLSDGTMLSMTYIPDQKMVAFCRHSTKGYFVACDCVERSQESVVYFVVERTINGSTVRYIERLSTREFDDIRKARFSDCAVNSIAYEAQVENVVITDTEITITTTENFFSAGVKFMLLGVAGIEAVLDANGDPAIDGYEEFNRKYFTIDQQLTPNTFTIATIDGTALTSSNYTGTYISAGSVLGGGTAYLCASTVADIDWLEGEDVSVLADGTAVTSTVSNGVITLAQAGPGYGIAHIGIPYTSDMRTLRIESEEGSIQGLRKRIIKTKCRLKDSVGGKIGYSEDSLLPIKWRQYEQALEPDQTLTGDIELTVKSSWNDEGHILFRQDEPLPMTILALIIDYEVEGT